MTEPGFHRRQSAKGAGDAEVTPDDGSNQPSRLSRLFSHPKLVLILSIAIALAVVAHLSRLE